MLMALALMLVCVIGGGLWWLSAKKSANPSAMKDYGTETQQRAAQSIVAGLNTRDPIKVDLIRNHSGNPDREADNARITDNISAVLPQPGCEYALAAVEDEGRQDPALVPWFSGPHQARGFDMKLRQLCPGRQPAPLTIRVIAIPSGMGGYWAEAALYPRAASATG
jgi:hypothetical protein